MKRLVEVELSLATVTFCGGFEGTGDNKNKQDVYPATNSKHPRIRTYIFRSGKIVLFLFFIFGEKFKTDESPLTATSLQRPFFWRKVTTSTLVSTHFKEVAVVKRFNCIFTLFIQN